MRKAEEIEQLKTLSAADQAELMGKKPAPKGPQLFFRTTQIKPLDRRKIIPVKSGVGAIDKKIGGFNLGELSIWSGSNGSGKSTFLNQMSIEAANQEFKAAIFTGELKPEREMYWLHLQAAGPNYVQKAQNDNYYYVPLETSRKFDVWAENKIFIYNNQAGLKADSVIKALRTCAEKEKINLVILDNLMSLQLGGGDKYEQQAALVLELSQFAKDCNVHVHFVAHPRKSIAFLRKTDISGTADITNAADNVFVIHRLNKDFEKQSKEFFGFDKGHPLYTSGFSNIIEICKNRDLGVQDELIGIFFDQSSKRFLNSTGEVKAYGWEGQHTSSGLEGFEPCSDESPF